MLWGDTQALPTLQTPEARLGPSPHPRGDPGLLPQSSPRDTGMRSEQTASCPLDHQVSLREPPGGPEKTQTPALPPRVPGW